MSEEQTQTETQELEITDEMVEAAVRTIIDYHRQHGLAFAIVNSGTGVMVSGGNAIELEGALNHAHRMMEFDNGTRFMEIRQRLRGGSQEEFAEVAEAAEAARAGK